MHSYDFPIPFNFATATNISESPSAPVDMQGLISEIAYCEEKPWVAHCLLLPLLQQLGHQSRWQLWLTPQQKLSRQWLQAANLPLNKIMQSQQYTAASTTIDAMAKALQTGNYSVVISWLNNELTDEEHHRLSTAAESGNALGFIMRPQNISIKSPRYGVKLYSSLYH